MEYEHCFLKEKENFKKKYSEIKMILIFVIFILFLSLKPVHSIEIGSEFSFAMLVGKIIEYEPESLGYPFDYQFGFGYTAIFSQYHMKVDGDLFYSISEFKSREILDTIGAVFDESSNSYIPICQKRKFNTVLLSANIVPCFTLYNFYAGLGASVKFKDVHFKDSIGDPELIADLHPYVSLGYSWKFIQLSLYIDDFVQSMGIQFKINLLSIRKIISSRRSNEKTEI